MTDKKTGFFNQLSALISEPIYLTDSINDLNEEIKHNNWVVTVPSEVIAQTTTTDFLDFIQKVKENYKSQLDNSQLDIDLIFYLWFEEPGELCFNFINSNHDTLPFGCKLKYTANPEEIVAEFLKSKHHDQVILWDELKAVETPEEIVEANRLEKELHDNFVLKVYQEKIKKQN